MFIFLAGACLIVPLASRFKLGSVLGYLIVGVLIGPFGLNLIANPEQIMHFAEFGIIMMLFLIGLELEPAKIWQLRKTIIGLGSLQVTLTTAVMMALGITAGWSWKESLAVSLSLSLSSTALVLQTLQEKNLMRTAMGETSFAVLLFQDIAVIPILIIMPMLAFSGSTVELGSKQNLLDAWSHASLISAVIAAVIVFGHYFSHHLFALIAKTNLREVFTATSLALIIGIALLMQRIGVSPGLGAFIAGVVLANSEYKRSLETDIEPFKGLLLGLFFISVGMSMNFNILFAQPIAVFSTVLLLISIKILLLYILGRYFGFSTLQTLGIAFILSQGSEFAFVLLQFAKDTGVLTKGSANFFSLAVVLSMATTPLLFFIFQRWILPRFLTILPKDRFDVIEEKQAVILAGYGRFGQVIGRFLDAQGIALTILEKDPDQIDLLRKFGFKGYFGDASRLDLLKNAGADEAKLLIVTVDDPDVCLDIVRLAKEEFPNLAIYARARNRRHAYELHKAGVHYFKRETFDSSLSMAKEIMKFLGHAEEVIEEKAKTFAEHDERFLKQSFSFFEKEQELISFSQQARGELERILNQDKQRDS